MPALLIWGTNDVALGIETTHGTEEWVPKVRIEYLEGANHWVQQERPEEVNGLMLSFLAVTGKGFEAAQRQSTRRRKQTPS